MIWTRIINSINLIPGFEEHSGTAWTRIFDIQLFFSLLYLTIFFSVESGKQEVSVFQEINIWFTAYLKFLYPFNWAHSNTSSTGTCYLWLEFSLIFQTFFLMF